MCVNISHFTPRYFSNGVVHIVPGQVVHLPAWLDKVDEVYGSSIVNETFSRWKAQLTYAGFGHPHVDPGHMLARFGMPGITYSYKGKPKPMWPMTPSLMALQKIIEEDLGWSSNCVVINSYAPESSLYPHHDSQHIPQLGNQPTIVSVSFGAARTFRLHPLDPIKGKRLKGKEIDVVLSSGDLLVMYGACDQNFHHSIPTEPWVKGTRMSLTFRRHIMPENSL